MSLTTPNTTRRQYKLVITYQAGNAITSKEWMKMRTAQAYHFYVNL